MGKLKILFGNIVSDEILQYGDSIVNPTNPMMRPGGGVSGAIFQKAGVDLLENYTSQKYDISYFNAPGKNEMQVTEVRITPGFNLGMDIIFAQGPKVWDYENYDEALELLLQTYKNILKTAIGHNYKHLLLPAIGTGSYGFEDDRIAQGVMMLLQSYVKSHELNVFFVLYEEAKCEIYKQYLIV